MSVTKEGIASQYKSTERSVQNLGAGSQAPAWESVNFKTRLFDGHFLVWRSIKGVRKPAPVPVPNFTISFAGCEVFISMRSRTKPGITRLIIVTGYEEKGLYPLVQEVPAVPPVLHWPPPATLPVQQGCWATTSGSESGLREGFTYCFFMVRPPIKRSGLPQRNHPWKSGPTEENSILILLSFLL